MSECQVWNEESFEFGQSLEAYYIHLSRNVREIVCEPKPCAFFDAFSSPLIFLFALKLEEMQSGAHQTCFSLFDSEDGAKNSPQETPFIDNSLAIKRTNGNVVTKFLWRARESIAEILLIGDRPLSFTEPRYFLIASVVSFISGVAAFISQVAKIEF